MLHSNKSIAVLIATSNFILLLPFFVLFLIVFPSFHICFCCRENTASPSFCEIVYESDFLLEFKEINNNAKQVTNTSDIPLYSLQVVQHLKAGISSSATFTQLTHIFKLNRDVLRGEGVTKITNRTMYWCIGTFGEYHLLFNTSEYESLPIREKGKNK